MKKLFLFICCLGLAYGATSFAQTIHQADFIFSPTGSYVERNPLQPTNYYVYYQVQNIGESVAYDGTKPLVVRCYTVNQTKISDNKIFVTRTINKGESFDTSRFKAAPTDFPISCAIQEAKQENKTDNNTNIFTIPTKVEPVIDFTFASPGTYAKATSNNGYTVYFQVQNAGDTINYDGSEPMAIRCYTANQTKIYDNKITQSKTLSKGDTFDIWRFSARNTDFPISCAIKEVQRELKTENNTFTYLLPAPFTSSTTPPVTPTPTTTGTTTIPPVTPPIITNGLVYYLDAINGKDTNNGDKLAPFKTFSKAIKTAKAGSTVLIFNGNYGDVIAGTTGGKNAWDVNPIAPYSLYTGWVTFKAAPGHTPHINTLTLGTLNVPVSKTEPMKNLPFSIKGNADAYIQFEGITFDDGITILGSRYVTIKDCTISRKNTKIVQQNTFTNPAVQILNGRYITLEHNDITNTAIGINAGSFDLTIKNNNIHNNSNDGIRILGGDGWLIEGNKIHDIDDGLNEGEPLSSHSDGIQLWRQLGDSTNLTVRGNLIYHIKSMGIMIGGSATDKHENWIFENNIFGPVGGILFHFGVGVHKNMIFRNNTILYLPNDKRTSNYRPMVSDQYTFAIRPSPELAANYKFYNNIFASTINIPTTYGMVSNNIFVGKNKVPGGITLSNVPYESITTLQTYIDLGKIPGTLLKGSPAINSGSKISPPVYDYLGNRRDASPDIGAIEYR